MQKRLALAALTCLLFAPLTGVLAADDLLTFRLECNNGVFKPKTLQVPVGKKFKVEIFKAIEFESLQLRKEKALNPGGHSFVVISPLEAGEYKFFDDFHIQTGQGSIVAR